jgi:type II secretory pathway pseudopilin PulG
MTSRKGFSLTEAIISMTVIALLTGAIAAVLMRGMDDWRRHWQSARDSEDVRMAFMRISNDIRDGWQGITSADTNTFTILFKDGSTVIYICDANTQTLSRIYAGDTTVILSNISNFLAFYFDKNNANLVTPVANPSLISLVSLRIVVNSIDLFTSIKTAK